MGEGTGCAVGLAVVRAAAASGKLERRAVVARARILQRAQGWGVGVHGWVSVDGGTACGGAGGHLVILKWAHAHGCPLNSAVFANAANGGILR